LKFAAAQTGASSSMCQPPALPVLNQVILYTVQLETNGYLLSADAAAVILEAMQPDMGNP